MNKDKFSVDNLRKDYIHYDKVQTILDDIKNKIIKTHDKYLSWTIILIHDYTKAECLQRKQVTDNYNIRDSAVFVLACSVIIEYFRSKHFYVDAKENKNGSAVSSVTINISLTPPISYYN